MLQEVQLLDEVLYRLNTDSKRAEGIPVATRDTPGGKEPGGKQLDAVL